jgi:aldehyde:ferredoxin oxidoreductase
VSITYGKILRIDLSSGSISEEVLSEDIFRRYVGGSGLNAKILYDVVMGRGVVKPLSSDNVLVFSVGPLTGTGFPLTSRYFVASISPLTGIYGQASSGGKFGSELRRCGYVSIVIDGTSEKPVYIKIDKEGVDIRDAKELWGYGTYETQEKLHRIFPKYSIACIGPAGERLVKYAAIINDEGRAAGRTGLGAVMGYKKLKAICVKGWLTPRIVNSDAFRTSVMEALDAVKKAPAAKILHDLGTSGMIEALHELGDVPIKNFSMGEWDKDKIRAISGVTIAKTVLKERYHCEACPVGCGRVVYLNGVRIDGPEYETVASFGTLLLNGDLRSILLANHLCNDYGLDTISTGVTIAFTMECVEKGLLKVDELNISWGNGEVIPELVRRIAFREGWLGNLLAEGVARASKVVGRGSEKFAMHVKGLEMPMHDPRAFKSWALGYATSNRGACHTYAPVYYIEKGMTFPEIGLSEPLDRFDSRSKPRAVKLIQDMAEFLDSMVMCRFCLYSGIKLPLILKALNAVLGTNITVNDAMIVGERVFNTKRLINSILGVNKDHDILPQRIFEPPSPPGGAGVLTLEEFNNMLKEYYELRGWTPNGEIPEDLIKRLEIN